MTHKDDIGITLGMGGTTSDPAQFTGCYTDAMQDARLRAMSNYAASGHAAVMTDEEKQRRKACPNKSLTKPPGHYLTGYEGSECEPIEDYDLAPFKWKQQGIDTDEFKKQCEEIERGES